MLVLDGSNGITGPQSDNDTTINGITVGKGGGTVATNTAVGVSALNAVNTGTGNNAFGYQALYNNTSGTLNNAFGQYALQANTSGGYNSAFGHNSLGQSTTASYNTAIGWAALYSNTTASNNTAVGYQAGYSNTSQGNNVHLGYQAGYSSTQDGNCTYVGTGAGYSANYGSSSAQTNTYIGYHAGYSMTTGYFNTILGSFSGNQGGLDMRTSTNYIVLSDGQGNPRGIFDGSGNYSVGTVSPYAPSAGGVTLTVNGGQSFVDVGHVSGTGSGTRYVGFYYNGSSIGSITQSGTTAVLYNVTSDQRLKENIVDAPDASADIDAIKVRSFDFISDKSPVKYGFIAQELVTVAPDAVHQPSNPDDMMGVDYSKLVPMMLKEIQSLRARLKAANIA